MIVEFRFSGKPAGRFMAYGIRQGGRGPEARVPVLASVGRAAVGKGVAFIRNPRIEPGMNPVSRVTYAARLAMSTEEYSRDGDVILVLPSHLAIGLRRSATPSVRFL